MFASFNFDMTFLVEGAHPTSRGVTGDAPPGNLVFFEELTSYFLHFESSSTNKYKGYKQMIITYIYFTTDFMVQPDQLHYKKERLSYILGGMAPNFYYWEVYVPTRPPV